MRTDPIVRPRALLLGALFLASAGGAAAQDAPVPTPAPAPSPAPVVDVHRSGDRIRAGGDLTIGREEVVVGSVVVMRGDLLVEGRVTGDATVGDGDLRIAEGGVVEGDVRVAGGSVTNLGHVGGDAVVRGGTLLNDGRIAGDMRVADEEVEARFDVEAREVVERSAAASALRVRRGAFAALGGGFADLVRTLVFGLVLGLVGAGIVFYAHPKLDEVSDELRRDTLRASGVGVLAGFLVFPLFVVLIVALAVTIIGIPLIVLAAPLYPLVVAAAMAFGLVAVAHAIGERTAEQRGSMEPRHRNGYAYVFTGLAVLLAPLVLASLLKMTGFLGFLGDMLAFLGGAAVALASLVGTGALILCAIRWWRASRRPYDPILDADPIFDSEPAAGGSHA